MEYKICTDTYVHAAATVRFLYWMSKVICHNKGFTCYFTDYYIASYSYIFFLPAALWNNRMSGGGYDYDFMTSLPA